MPIVLSYIERGYEAQDSKTTVSSISCRQNAKVEVSVLLEAKDTAAFLAIRMNKGGCQVASASGVFLWLDANGFFNVTTDLGEDFLCV